MFSPNANLFEAIVYGVTAIAAVVALIAIFAGWHPSASFACSMAFTALYLIFKDHADDRLRKWRSKQ